VSRTLLTERPLTVGDPVDVALIVFHERGEKPRYPEDAEDFAPFTLRETRVKTRRLGGGTSRTLVVYTLVIFATGTFELPPAAVRVGDRVLETEPLEIRVLSVLPKDVDDPPLKEIVPPYNPRMRPLLALVIGGALAAAAAAARFLRRFLKRRLAALPEAGVQAPEEDPYIVTIRELDSLKRERPEVKESYSRISSALRFFVGRTLGIDALVMTTTEIGRKLRRGRRSRAQRVEIPSDRVMAMLKKSDLVKFAREAPASAAVAGDIEETLRIVEEVHASAAREAQSTGGAGNEGGVA
jgi:hypothetical protein